MSHLLVPPAGGRAGSQQLGLDITREVVGTSVVDGQRFLDVRSVSGS